MHALCVNVMEYSINYSVHICHVCTRVALGVISHCHSTAFDGVYNMHYALCIIIGSPESDQWDEDRGSVRWQLA